MKDRIQKLLLTSTFVTTLLFSQKLGNQPDPATLVQHRVNFLTTILSLTAAQQQQAMTIFTDAATTALTVRSNLKTAHQSLGNAVKSNDISSIDQVSITIGNLTAQQVSTKAKANAAFYQILTPDQQAKFNQIQSQRHGRFGGRGPGGFLGDPQ
jgi:Spy/CpxP family protein refolding chaperone